MGQSLTTMYRTYYSSPDTSPDGFGDPIHRPNYGFPAERKKRKPTMTEEQMEAADIDPFWRDFCASDLLEFKKCKREHFPWVIACKPYKHQWEQCEAEDHILRMKEYERERRLMERAKKKKQLAAERSKEILVE